MAYPLVTACLVLLLGAGVLGFAAPRLWAFGREVGGRSPLPWALGALGGLALVFGGTLFLAHRIRRGRGRGFWLPVLGPLRLKAARASLASTLALLLRRGLPLHEVLREAAATCEQEDLRARVAQTARRVEEGQDLVEAAREGDILEASLLYLVEAGARDGHAAEALEDVARIQRERLERSLDRCSVLVRPVLELGVGAAVLVFAYAFLVPIFEYATNLLRI